MGLSGERIPIAALVGGRELIVWQFTLTIKKLFYSSGAAAIWASAFSWVGSSILRMRRLNTTATATSPAAKNIGIALTVWSDRDGKSASRSNPARMGPMMSVRLFVD